MAQLNFNAAQYEPSTGAADVLETGIYSVQIVNSEIKQTKAKDGYMLVFTMACLEAPFTGRKIVARLNIHNPNPTAMEIAYRELSAISHVVGVIVWQDTQQLHGRPFKVAIEKVERNDKPGAFSNDIKAYMDYTGNPPNPSTAGSGSSPAPAAPPAPPTAAPVQQPQAQSPAAPAPQPMTAAPAPAGFPTPAAPAAPATAAPAPAWQQPQQQAAAPAAVDPNAPPPWMVNQG